MVLFNEINDRLVEFVFSGQLHPAFDVVHDHELADRGFDEVMFIKELVLVFNEVFRFLEFSDIVVIGADARQQRIGADAFGSSLCEIADDERMVIRARSFDLEFFEEFRDK